VLLGASTGIVPFLSDTYEGSCHDKPIADQTPYPLGAGSELLQDLGFLGFTLEGVQITQPHKKPRGQELTDEQKAQNRVIAARRVLIEHIICSIKRCRIVKDTLRLWKDTARDMVMAVCCGLHNFRLRLCPWPSLCQ
jgi:DDE superfamily endonuclease